MPVLALVERELERPEALDRLEDLIDWLPVLARPLRRARPRFGLVRRAQMTPTPFRWTRRSVGSPISVPSAV